MIEFTPADIVIGLLYLAALWLSSWWFSRDPRPACHCDEANQGRTCRNCLPPHIPRAEP